MTSTLSGGSVNIARKVIVKGKYLASIESYVETLVLGDNFLFAPNPEYEALLDNIVKIHGRFLSKSGAEAIIFNLCIEFEREHIGRTGPLSDPSNADLKASLVDYIKKYVESLPRKYTLRIELASFPPWDAATYKISESTRIITGNPLPTGLNALVRLTPVHGEAYPHFNTYMEFSAIGYSDWSWESLTASACLSLAKQCAFILASHGICKQNYSGMKASATLTDNSAGITRQIHLPDSISRCFGQMIPDDKKLLVYDNKGAPLLTDTGRQASSNEERGLAFGNLLQHAVRFFEAEANPDFEGISVAIEWYQDSIFADNQSFSYIAACIGLEALFGSDSHLENMSKRLADRYAFLLGKSRFEREKMIALYTSVLNLRGRLVHSKVARLGDEERGLLRAAQKMLRDAILHELYAMYKSTDY